jgi:carbamoyl-phosphate synthase large subunit
MKTNNKDFNILFTSVGRRVSLIRHFQKTLADMGLKGSVVGIDVSEDAPAFHVTDKSYKVCPIDSPSYIQNLIEICKKERIKLLFPLIDTDLLKLAENRAGFLEVGTEAVISDPDVIITSIDKYKTHDFFVSKGLSVPKVFDIESSVADELNYPLFIKPMDGNASKGIFKVKDKRELLFFKGHVQKPILQEYLHGTEFTLDMLFDFKGNLRCVVPRRRIEVRAGEVSKAVIDNNKNIMEQGWRAGNSIKGARGCINIQCFLTRDTNEVKFVEINPRFGGGVPLSLRAGADFPRWIIEMARGNDPGDIRDAYRKNVYMLRYDDAIFLDYLPS